jgi:hypothetical protein
MIVYTRPTQNTLLHTQMIDMPYFQDILRFKAEISPVRQAYTIILVPVYKVLFSPRFES